MNDETVEFWNLIYAAGLCDSDKLSDVLHWRGSRAYLIVEIAGYTRSTPISKDAARAILKDAAYIRALEYDDSVYLIADGVAQSTPQE